MFQIEILYNGQWHFFESADDPFTARRVRGDIGKSLRLPSRVTCAGIEVIV